MEEFESFIAKLRISLVFICLLSLAHNTNAQDKKLSCASGEIIAQNGNKSHIRSVVNLPYKEVDSLDIPIHVRDSAYKYLLGRVGLDFMQKLIPYKFGQVFYDKAEEIRKEKPWTRESSDHRIKYFLEFYFDLENDLQYYITLTYDDKGNMISKHQLPDRHINTSFAEMMPICDAVVIAEKDSIFSGKAVEISLEYMDSTGSFVWSVEKPSIPGRYNSEFFKRFILLDAVTGEVLSRKMYTSVGVCDGNMPHFPELYIK